MKDYTGKTKDELYATAVAGISCAYFNTGDHVAIRFDYRDPAGTAWFEITSANGKKPPTPILYPKHHLHSFVL